MTNTPGRERYAIIEVPDGPAPANSMMTGPLDTIMKWLPDTLARNDEIKRLDAARFDAAQIDKIQEVTTALQIANFCDTVNRATRRMDSFEARRVESIIKARRDREAEEHKFIEDQISRHPDPDAPTSWDGGDLHTHQATEPMKEQQLAHGEPKASYAPTDQGSLPRELTEEVPVDPGTNPALSGAKEPEAKNPVGISW